MLSPLDTYLATIDNDDQRRAARAALTGVNQKEIKWTLLNTFVKNKLDLTQHAAEKEFETWKRQFLNFANNSNLNEESVSWANKLAAIEASSNAETYDKIGSIHDQLPVGDKFNLETLLNKIGTMAGCVTNVWIHRKSFEQLVQKDHQPFRNYYTEVIAAANKCDFHKRFCAECNQVARDERILNRIIFGINNPVARQKIFEESDLNLIKAVQIIEAAEAVRDTEKDFVSKNIQAVQKRPKKDKNSSTVPFKDVDRKHACYFCGHPWNPQHLKICPARGKICHDCGKKGHFAGTKTCKGKPMLRKENFVNRHSDAVINSIATETDTVEIQIHDHEQVYCHKAMIDTGSDWDCLGVTQLNSLGRDLKSLLPPDWEMQNTKVADGRKLTALGHYPVELRFGPKNFNTKLVIFKELDKMILSKRTLENLGIVVINKYPEEPFKDICPVTKISRILLPYNEGKIVMNINGSENKKFDLGSVTQESLIEEFSDVFHQRLDPMPGEKFRIELEANAKPCKVSYARHIPIAFKEKLKMELDTLVDNGIISPVSKPTDWCNPIVVTSKKNSDQIRLCVDFRQLNRSVARELYPTKSVLEACQNIARDEAKIFSKFDTVKGYHQIPLDEESKDLTTFITPFGRFRYERAPFGICSISEHYDRE